MVSHDDPSLVGLVAEVCQSFALDNGAYPRWRSGKPVHDWSPFYEWVEEWYRHPGFDWYLIPDVIDGSEDDNDRLIKRCAPIPNGVPVWHLHESLNRLARLAGDYGRVALGSSGTYAQIKTPIWWRRMDQAMAAITDGAGRPRAKLHGLRMLDPDVFTQFPFASADSTNVCRNINLDTRWNGTYAPASKGHRGMIIAGRIEAQQSAPAWRSRGEQGEFVLKALPTDKDGMVPA